MHIQCQVCWRVVLSYKSNLIQCLILQINSTLLILQKAFREEITCRTQANIKGLVIKEKKYKGTWFYYFFNIFFTCGTRLPPSTSFTKLPNPYFKVNIPLPSRSLLYVNISSRSLRLSIHSLTPIILFSFIYLFICFRF